MLDFDQLELRYEPYPIGLAKGVFDQATYDSLVASYPSLDLFKYMPHLGKKYSLSELNHPKAYKKFIHETPIWRELHGWFKSRAFLRCIFKTLEEAGVPLRLHHHGSDSFIQRCRGKILETQSIALSGLLSYLTTRFEFSAMPADGGMILPHTDAPNKLVTLVLSMNTADEWDAAYGGGTNIVHPKDNAKYYNQFNNYLGFDEVETVSTFDFTPNQCLIFVKTFNSWHSVNPMIGPADAIRKTLTVNIERKWF